MCNVLEDYIKKKKKEKYPTTAKVLHFVLKVYGWHYFVPSIDLIRSLRNSDCVISLKHYWKYS